MVNLTSMVWPSYCLVRHNLQQCTVLVPAFRLPRAETTGMVTDLSLTLLSVRIPDVSRWLWWLVVAVFRFFSGKKTTPPPTTTTTNCRDRCRPANGYFRCSMQLCRKQSSQILPVSCTSFSWRNTEIFSKMWKLQCCSVLSFSRDDTRSLPNKLLFTSESAAGGYRLLSSFTIAKNSRSRPVIHWSLIPSTKNSAPV